MNIGTWQSGRDSVCYITVNVYGAFSPDLDGRVASVTVKEEYAADFHSASWTNALLYLFLRNEWLQMFADFLSSHPQF